MNQCECCRHLGVIDFIRWGVYLAGTGALWPWYQYLDEVAHARTAVKVIPELEPMVHNLYFAYLIYPAVLAVCLLLGMSLVRGHRKYLGTLVALIPLGYLGGLYIYGNDIKQRAHERGKEIFREEARKAVGKLLEKGPREFVKELPGDVGEAIGKIGEKLF